MSLLQGQAVITETLLKTQQEQQEEGGVGGDRGEVGRRHHHLSSTSSSQFSDGFEVIEEEPEVELCEWVWTYSTCVL